MAANQATQASGDEPATGFTALVLVGGLGTRLRAVVGALPKPLAPVGGEPFLARVLQQLAQAGCDEAILCTGHGAEAIEREFGRDFGGMPLRYSREAEPMGTGGALRLAMEVCRRDAVLVCNGDSFCDCDLRAFVRELAATNGNGIVIAEVADTGRFGRVELAADGTVAACREKGVLGPGWISAGIYWLRRAAVQSLPSATPCSFELDLLPSLVGAGLRAFRGGDRFLDIGVPADLARAEQFFAACERAAARPRTGLLVVDRDGTLIAERNYLSTPDQVELLPGVVDGLRSFRDRGYEIAVVTNQSGIGRGYFDEAALQAVHTELRRQLGRHGIEVRGIWHCPHTPDAGCRCRKPRPELLERCLDELGYRPQQCLVVGDKRCDIELGAGLGVRTALVRTGYGAGTERDGQCTPDLVVDDLGQLAAIEVGP
jgi:histidinol-phosphate phosphatase family protein